MGRRYLPILSFVVLIAAGGLPERATIRTLDGRSYEGRLELADGDAVVIIPRGAEPVVVSLAELKAAIFHPPASADLPANRQNDETPLKSDPKEGEAISTGLLLRDGSTIIGTIRSVDENGVTFVRQGAVRLVKPQALARVVFSQVLPEGADAAARGHVGAIMESGDFFEGELRSFDAGRVTISSVLFGNRTFTAAKELLAIVYNDAKPVEVRFVIQTADGSNIRATSLHVNKQSAIAEDGVGGKWDFAADEVQSIRAGGEE